MRIAPPRSCALFESLVPNFFPTISPAVHITNVTIAIIKDGRNAPKEEYSAIVKPTDSASIDVAIP